jgi:dipeptidyl aminopeptidase/acylaminoacyl peptidase
MRTGPYRVSEAVACLAVVLFLAVPVAAEPGYQRPPKSILDILDAPPTPQVSINPTGTHLLLLQGEGYPPIADLAEPMLRLAGHRINLRTNGPHHAPRIVALSLLRIADGREQKIALPAAANVGSPSWSANGDRFAFTNTTAAGVELWMGELSTGAIRRLEGVVLNAALGSPFHWMPDDQTLLCRTVVASRGGPPAAPPVPAGPVIQEGSGKPAPVRTYQDLLRNPHDEDLFDYYATAQLALVDCQAGHVTPLGKPAVFAEADPSPDGKHLLVARMHRPYSYLHPSMAFPKEVEVWDLSGRVEYHLASLPLADQVPIDGVPTGPRAYQWQASQPATLVWVEALDGGDPRRKVPYRDRVLRLPAPFQGGPVRMARTQHRYQSLTWGEKADLALLSDYDRDRRWTRTIALKLDEPGVPGRVIWDRSVLDRYGDPGTPVLRTLPGGLHALRQHGNCIYLIGRGAAPLGEQPFLDRLDLATLKTERLFQSDAHAYELVLAVLDEDGTRFLTRHESPNEPPNYFVRSVADGAKKALTHFPDPAPQLRGVRKQLVTYKRADGVQLSFTLYLPSDYKAGQRLPTVLWAYPLEYTDAGTAGQVSGSPNHFTTPAGISHLFFLTQGYAILDGATMPVVGHPETANNTYLEQVVASARAAIDKAVDMGVTDRQRVGVGGHSYGAFMTANLLAHSDLFRAGLARSGAYNRTLTPFGFQSERRTLWEAPEVYLKVSPFMYADKIKAPLLLIHGAADNNPGTFPIQSERMYQAVKGNGGTVRFVSLPYESHGYVARESVEHTLYEMVSWFDKYVKHAGERTAAAPAK